jgi:hypothetical protein
MRIRVDIAFGQIHIQVSPAAEKAPRPADSNDSKKARI